MKIAPIVLLPLIFSACSKPVKEYRIENPPKLSKDRKYTLGGLSGLHPLGANKRGYAFATLTDRGPNAESYKEDGEKLRPFPLPEYHPEILTIMATEKGINIVKRLPLTGSRQNEFTGIPNAAKVDETPVDMKGKRLGFEKTGVDPEGIAADSMGNFWIVEEYGPSLLKVSPNGKVLKRFIPEGSGELRYGIEALPGFLSNRRKNRGFEGLAIEGDTLFLVLQSPIKKGDKFWVEERAVPLIAFDIKEEKTQKVYAYKFANKKATKVGALASMGQNKLLLLEQNSKDGNKAYKAIARINLSKAQSLKDDERLVLKAEKSWRLEDFFEKVPEKLEGLAWLGDGKVALITDNDFDLSHLENPEEEESEQTVLVILELP